MRNLKSIQELNSLTMKVIVLEKVVIVDGFSKLLVIDKSFFNTEIGTGYFASLGYAFHYRVGGGTRLAEPCNVHPYKTQKGKEALRIWKGKKYLLDLSFGTGSRRWNDWNERKMALENNNDTVLFSEAIPTSNGGGNWQECQIWLYGTTPLSQDQADAVSLLLKEFEDEFETDEDFTFNHNEFPEDIDDGLGGMDKMDEQVARLDEYYSRNNIKSDIDDDDESEWRA